MDYLSRALHELRVFWPGSGENGNSHSVCLLGSPKPPFCGSFPHEALLSPVLRVTLYFPSSLLSEWLLRRVLEPVPPGCVMPFPCPVLCPESHPSGQHCAWYTGCPHTCLLQGWKAGRICVLSLNFPLGNEIQRYVKQMIWGKTWKERPKTWVGCGKWAPPKDYSRMSSDPQFVLIIKDVHVGFHSGHAYLCRCWPYMILNQRTVIRSLFLLLWKA